MTLWVAILAGAGFGLGLILLARALRPRPVPLADVFADLQRPRTPTTTTPAPGRGWRGVIGLVEKVGLVDTETLTRRLRILDTTPEQHVTTKLTVAIAGMGIPVLFAAVLRLGGITVPVGLVTVGAVVLGTVGFVWPDVGLADRVEQRRRGFRHALSAYLDLVTVILAGGGGLETALHTAAEAGDGWAFAEIRHALHRARFTGQTPWDVFDSLGRELGIDELSELAASAHLAGDQGARIRTTLAAKADTMRAHQTAAIEAAGEAATEKMLLPVVGLVVGMILFIGYGVVEAISTPDPTSLIQP